MTNQFQTLSSTDLETVAGGLSISLDLSKGISVESKLGTATLKFPKPSDILTNLKNTISSTIENVGKLVDLGQLFNFS